MTTPGVAELARALQELYARFAPEEITATYQVPGPGEHLITLALTGGTLLTLNREDGHIQAITLQELDT